MTEGNAAGAESLLVKGDLVPHAPAGAAEDAFDHDAVAAVVTDLVMNVDAPANVALFGPWGSGKSSLYGMVRDRVERKNAAADELTRVFRYDAWKFGGHSLQRNFISAVAEGVGLSEKDLAPIYGATETARLRLGQFLARNKASIFLAGLIAVGIGTAWSFLKAWIDWSAGANGNPRTYMVEVSRSASAGLVVTGVVITALLLSNQVLSSAIEKRTQSPLQDADQFADAFEGLMKVLTKKKWWKKRVSRLVIFIDELDRCKPHEVATTLTDLLTFLDHKDCVFVVAADREALEEAIEKAPQAKPIREDEPYYSTAGAFLDKVFHHQMSLPPVRAEALTVYARNTVDKQQGLWSDLRSEDGGLYDDVVYSLVPTHVRSPRRVKVLLNNYATNVRVLQARRMAWESQAVQIAVFTVLQTEFPSALGDFVEQPRLLHALTGQESTLTPRLQRLVDKYKPADPEAVAESPRPAEAASPLLTDEKKSADAEGQKRATNRLNQQLHDYLGRIAAARIEFPTLELAYLQQAGHADGIDDVDFARALDAAADIAPATTMKTLWASPAWTSQANRVAAIRYLVAHMSSRFGPLRDNLVEVAAQIAASLDPEPAAEVARLAAPTLLHEAARGRWRKNATPGALRLGLLDTQMGDPFELLPAEVIENVYDDGVLEAITENLTELPPGRAQWTFRYLAAAYPEDPSHFLAALRSLPAAEALDLWRTQLPTLKPFFETLPEREPIDAVEAGLSRTTVAARNAAPMDPSEIADDRTGRLRMVFETLMIRDNPQDRGADDPTSELWAEVIAYAADRDRADDDGPYAEVLDPIHKMATSYAAVFADMDHNNSAFINVTLCDAFLASPDLRTALDWGEHLVADHCPLLSDDPDSIDPKGLYQSVGRALVRYLTKPVDGALRDRAVEVYGVIAELLAPNAENAGAATIFSALKANPPSAANTEIRANQLRLLEQLIGRGDEALSISDFVRHSIEEVLADVPLAADDLPHYQAEIALLTADDAVRLLTAIGALPEPADTDEAIQRTRLLIAANARAGKQPLKPPHLLRIVDEGPASRPLLREWMETNPTGTMVATVARRAPLTATDLSAWAARRNATERSKVWIALEKYNYRDDLLAAVGAKGVNRTVVDHIASRITNASADEQPNETRRLLTADLTSRDARIAAHDLAVVLLNTGLARSVPSAVKILAAANGGDPNRRKSLASTLKPVSETKAWQRLPHADREAMQRFHLVAPTKKSIVDRIRDHLPV